MRKASVTERPLLLFDGRCGLCTRTVQLIRRLDRHGRLEDAPSQNSAAREGVGVSLDEAAAAVWLLHPDGTRLQGAAAVSAIGDLLLGTGSLLGDGLLLRLHRLPGLGALQDRAYAWVAANRHRLPGMVPWCTTRPGECDERRSDRLHGTFEEQHRHGSDIVGP